MGKCQIRTQGASPSYSHRKSVVAQSLFFFLGRSGTQNKQAGWFLRPDSAPSSECLPNVVPNSEFRTCPDPKFPNTLHSKFMNTPNVEFLNVPLSSVPMSYSYLASSKWGRPLCYEHAATRWCLQRGRGCRVRTCVTEIGADFKMSLLRQFW